MGKIELSEEVFKRIKDSCEALFNDGEDIPLNRAFDKLMKVEGVLMHCPYHHFIIPAAMLTLTALSEKRSIEQLRDWLDIAEERAVTVPGGFCGNCGACGAGIGMGIFASVYTEATPLSSESWKTANEVTGMSLCKISEYSGPRCCKRTAYLAAMAAVPYLNERLGTGFSLENKISCRFSKFNADCLTNECPFYIE